MNTIKQETIDSEVYKDRARTEKLVDSDNVAVKIRTLLLQIIDSPCKTPMSLSRMKSLERLYAAVSAEGDVALEDADYNFLMNHIDEVGIVLPYVYNQLQGCLQNNTKTS